MARINIEEKLFADARFVALCNKVSRREAIGMMVDAWLLAQKHWLKDHKYIPEQEFLMAGLEPLLECFFAQKMDNGYYIRGSEDQFGWLKKRQEDGKKGGKRSVEARLKKYGKTSILRSKHEAPLHAPFIDPSCEMNPLTLTPTLTLNTYTQTDPSVHKAKKQTKPKIGTHEVIARYCELFEQRYGIKAVIAGVEAGQLGRLTKAHGQEQAIKIVEGYFQLQDQFIIGQCHPVGMIEKQINKILVSQSKQEPKRRWLKIPTGDDA